MTTPIATISAREALAIAAKAAHRPDTEAPDLPTAIRVGNEVHILVFFLGRGGPPPIGYQPPQFAVTLTLDGKVVEAGPKSAQELGILTPDATEPGVGTADDLTVDEFLRNEDKFYDLSPKVWAAFAAGRTAMDPGVRPLLAEYWRLFNASCAHGVAPFHLQASPAFFAWVRSAADAANP